MNKYKLNIDDCTNEKTNEIYNNLKNNGYNIELEVNSVLLKGKNGCWGMQPTFKILAPSINPNKAAFTHELLHIQLFQMGFKNHEIIFDLIKDCNNQGNIFTLEFILATNNNIAHLKMADLFVKCGFGIEEFLHESGVLQLTKVNEQINSLPEKGNELLMKFVNIFSVIKLLKQYYALDTKAIEQLMRTKYVILFNLTEELFAWWFTSKGADNLQFYKKMQELMNNIH